MVLSLLTSGFAGSSRAIISALSMFEIACTDLTGAYLAGADL